MRLVGGGVGHRRLNARALPSAPREDDACEVDEDDRADERQMAEIRRKQRLNRRDVLEDEEADFGYVVSDWEDQDVDDDVREIGSDGVAYLTGGFSAA